MYEKDLKGGAPEENAKLPLPLNEKEVAREMLHILNAGAALHIGEGKSDSMKRGYRTCRRNH